MPINLVRVVNEQTLDRSILLDKIDRCQGHFEGSARVAKQKLYVPYSNPLDPTVKGYVDLVPTNEVLLQTRPDGVIGGLAAVGRVSAGVVSSALIAAAAVTAATNAVGNTTIGGTVFLSVTPDVTRAELTNLVGVTQIIPQSAFTTHTAISIVIPDGAVSGGPPAVGWKVRIFANSKWSNQFTLT